MKATGLDHYQGPAIKIFLHDLGVTIWQETNPVERSVVELPNDVLPTLIKCLSDHFEAESGGE